MTMSAAREAMWPALPYDEWADTCATLHRWTQVVGKIRLAHTPWLNHSWHVPLYVSARGLTTSPIPYDARTFEIAFDFSRHVLDIAVSDGTTSQLALRPQSVAAFYRELTAALAGLGLPVTVDERPCEIAGAVPFSDDHEHAAYDAVYAQRFFQILLRIDRIFKQFRTGFIGKASPVHFFWGSFDLAVTRFSGRRAPPFRGSVPGVALAVMQDAYSHEVSSAGFWPGSADVDASFYSYAYPEPPGFRDAAVQPAAAHFSEQLGEFLLPYDAVRTDADPEVRILEFLQSTYDAAARTAQWERAALECPLGKPGPLPKD
jgi:hypothetical protein